MPCVRDSRVTRVACISHLLDSRRQLVSLDGAESLQQPVLSSQGSRRGLYWDPFSSRFTSTIWVTVCHLGHRLNSLLMTPKSIKPFAAQNQKREQAILQHDLTGMQGWADTWQMEFSPPKCAHLPIGPPRDCRCTIGGTVIGPASVQRDLGVLVPRDLLFSEHAVAVTIDCSRRSEFCCASSISSQYQGPFNRTRP